MRSHNALAIMNESKCTSADYRSPYVWQSRAINFNKQLIHKHINHAPRCNKPKTKPKTRAKTFGVPQHRNGEVLLRNLRRLPVDLNSKSNSSGSAISTCSTADEREETPFVKNFAHRKYRHANKMSRCNYLNHVSRTNNVNHIGSRAAYSVTDKWCPLHGSAKHHHVPTPFQHSLPQHYLPYEPMIRRPSLADLKADYRFQSGPYLPYGYLYSDNQFMPTQHPHIYSSQIYLPNTYLPMQAYLNPNLYRPKPTPSPLQQLRNHSIKCNNSMRLYSESKVASNKCKGHFVVLAIILTVITIGVIMGVILAVTID